MYQYQILIHFRDMCFRIILNGVANVCQRQMKSGSVINYTETHMAIEWIIFHHVKNVSLKKLWVNYFKYFRMDKIVRSIFMDHFCLFIHNGSYLWNIILTKFGTIYSKNFNSGESVVALWKMSRLYIRFVFTCFDIWDWKFLILNRSSPVKRRGWSTSKWVNHCVFWLAILDRIDFFIDFTITRKWLKTLRQTPDLLRRP